MIVAFCLYKYFPFGGLQRDFMRIASTVAARGHHVRVYTQSWEGDCPEAFELIRVPVKSHTNHGRNAEYYARVQNHLKAHPADRVVGFNKMPGWMFILPPMSVMPRKWRKKRDFLSFNIALSPLCCIRASDFRTW